MTKAELSRFLEDKVREKESQGYCITTYAMDAASRDKVKRDLRAPSHAIPHDNHAQEDWQEYLRLAESGEYQKTHQAPDLSTSHQDLALPRPVENTTSSPGLWKSRRH